MPRLSDDNSALPLLNEARSSIVSAWDGFIDFLFSDNVLEVAVGLIIASSFTSLIKAFTNSLLLPLISLIPGLGRNFSELFAVLRHGDSTTHGGGSYNTVKQANDDGALVLAYGDFIDNLITFLLTGLSLYLIAQGYQWSTGDRVVKRTVKCKFCRKRVSDKAKRCFCCTSWLDGREEN